MYQIASDPDIRAWKCSSILLLKLKLLAGQKSSAVAVGSRRVSRGKLRKSTADGR